MTRLSAAALAALLASPLVTQAAAQTKTLQGETKTVTATVEAIDAKTRTLTLKGPEGNYVDVEAGPDVTRFNEIKVGDKITARYYENVVLRVKQPGEKSVDSDADGITRGAGAKPGGTVAAQRTITATITGDRSGGPFNHLYRPEQLEVQLPRRGREGAGQGQGRRQGRHHVDRGPARVARGAEVARAAASVRGCGPVPGGGRR